MVERPIVKEEWARSIMGQALAEIRTVADIPRVMRKVGSTAVGCRDDMMKVFREIVEMKRKRLVKVGLLGKPEKSLCPRERRRGINKKEHCAAFVIGICDGEPEKINKQTCMHPEEVAQ